ncbi:MAG: NUDIX hydrolase N-terminal domain-containing protein [Anaerolineae bacterium]|nr:NUDIX hydrolase N-terminal domain-containing protein [Anaerolineae bacterium]
MIKHNDIPSETINRLRQIAESGLSDGFSIFDRERYGQVLDLVTEMAEAPVGYDASLVLPSTVPQTPKTGVRGAAFKDGKILLVQNAFEGLWTIPGGYADVGDTPAQIAAREFFEESGYEVRVTKLIGVYNRSSHDHAPSPNEYHMFFFLCEILGGGWQPNHETSAAGFYGPDELPPLDLMTVTPYQIERCFAHYHQPDLPTEFD